MITIFLRAWGSALDPAEVAALTDGVRNDLLTLTNFILELRPDVELLLSFYDYRN